METLFAILGWILFGLIAGAIARLLIPGRQPMSLAMTMLLGVLGSFAGGFITWMFVGGDPLQAAGWIMSIIGAVVVLLVYVQFARRRHT